MHLFALSEKHTNMISLLKIFLIALLYFLAGKMSLGIASENHIITIVIFAAEGFALAGVLLFGKSILPGIFLGQLLLALDGNIAFLPAFGIALVNTLEALIAWKILNHFKFDRHIKHPNDLFLLFCTIACILQPFSAFFGTSILYSASIVTDHDFLSSLFSWWFGNTLGQMLWTPMLLLLYLNIGKVHYLELILYTLLFLLFSWVVFIILPISNLSIAMVLTLPFAVYIAIQKGLLFASIMIVILSMVSIYATYQHTGIFSSMSMIDNIINLNFYILSHILIVLGIGVLYWEMKQTKKALADLNRSLEEEVERQVEKLNRQNIIMAQQARLASMGEMLGMIAHQWRQPLNTINSNIAVIQKVVSDTLHNHIFLEQKLENITKQTQFMSDTIEDFSGFFHPNKQAVHFNPCDTLQRAFKLIHMETRHITTDITCPDEPVTLYSYENEYLQVLLSILHNALENFTLHQIENPTLKFIFQTDQEYITLYIQDNGGGIKAIPMESIFDPYVTTNNTKKNSGLGLYMAKLLIEESMHGILRVKNQNGGACFEITLPKGEKRYE